MVHGSVDDEEQLVGKSIRVIGRTDNSIRIKGVDWMPNEVAEQVVHNNN